MSKSGREKYKPITYENSRAVGNIGEAVAIAEFTKLGIPVFTPFGQNTPVDMMICVNGMYLKVQCKTTECIKNGKMEFSIARTNGFTNSKNYYTRKEVDLFFLYCIENGWTGLITFDECPSNSLIIRVAPPLNNNKIGIKWPYMYDFHERIKILQNTIPAVYFYQDLI